jgi:hypothetical protein
MECGNDSVKQRKRLHFKTVNITYICEADVISGGTLLHGVHYLVCTKAQYFILANARHLKIIQEQ